MANDSDLLSTPLTGLHQELGAKMVGFAGYAMPLQYPLGIMKEHLHTRARAGLFDVSHMGQVRLSAPEGGGESPAAALESLVPVDVLGLPVGRQRYALFTDENGGILDDLMIANGGDGLYLVVNASRKAEDIAHLQRSLPGDTLVEPIEDRALMALQGPEAALVLSGLAPSDLDMRFMDWARLDIQGAACFVTRSGYTGEDGFEISVPAEAAVDVARRLLAHEAVEPVGLGARDSLRLEAGLCLYGQDIDQTTSPVEAGLTWSISKARRHDGARVGGFPGSARILAEMEEGPSRRRVGLRPEGRAPVREGAILMDEGENEIGRVTSGVFGPSVEGPVAMGYVERSLAEPGTKLTASVRGRAIPVEVARLPFITPGYARD